MYSSKELMDKAGVSRATLNNYIGMGLIPKPIVKNPDSTDDKARRLGYFPEDALDRLHEIDVPVLFMTGQFDEARPETVAGFQKLIPGSQFTVIEDAGHATLSKHPEKYRTILENFLESVENPEH